MNKRMVAFFLGYVLRIEAALLILPIIVSLIYREQEAVYLAVIAVCTFGVGFLISARSPKNTSFYTREGFIAVALSWVVLSVIGALPFYLTGSIPSFTDALFETISGFTTTGASILSEVESIPKGVLFWRSFTHWVGGMGVLVFMLAILPFAAGDNIHIMRAESPGPSVGKLVPKVKSTAKILYAIYIGITLLEIICLKISGMTFYESVVMTFGTVGTGGFAVLNTGCTGYTTLQQGILTFFMILCGVNFNAYYLILVKKFKDAFCSEEVITYLSIVAFASITIALNIKDQFESFGMAFHHSIFNVASCMTTTGFASADFDLWPTFSKMMLVTIMFVGGCAGSTAGGMKVSRIVIASKTVRKEFSHLIHPRSVKVLKFDGKVIEHSVIRGVNVYIIVYFMILFGSILLVSLDGKDVVTTVTSVIATINNIGPGLANVGPMSNFGHFSVFSKYVLMFDMLAGRLELFPLILLFMPKTWRQ